jgi:virginiamycin A acetyltransferase
MIDFPSAATRYPMGEIDRVCFLKNIITHPNIIVGNYTYYDDEEDVHNFEKNVMYHYDFLGDKLIIGRFCQIASGVKFLMNGMFHNMSVLTTFPFSIFSKDISERYKVGEFFPTKGDTVIENDVWIGYNVTIMPGVHVENGAVIGTNALITKDVGPYEIWGGNPATLIRKRLPDDVIDVLLQVQWWNWSIEKILENVDVLLSNDKGKLVALM